MKPFAAAEFSKLLLQSKRPTAASQFVGCVGVGIARKLKLPPWQQKSLRAHSRAVQDSKPRIKRKRRAKRHDATRWRTHSSGTVDADSRAVFHRSARLSRDGHAPGRAHGPVVQRVHGDRKSTRL